jgi:GNAT superfamily N-acetyltransferase
MNLRIYTVDKYLSEEIVNFIKTSGLTEEFDCQNFEFMVLGITDKEISGLVAYGITKVSDGSLAPRFLHVIVAKKFRGSRMGVRLMLASEKVLRERGYDKSIALIRHDLPKRDMKITYALKFGYQKYAEDKDGEYFYKTLTLLPRRELCVAEQQ